LFLVDDKRQLCFNAEIRNEFALMNQSLFTNFRYMAEIACMIEVLSREQGTGSLGLDEAQLPELMTPLCGCVTNMVMPFLQTRFQSEHCPGRLLLRSKSQALLINTNSCPKM